MNSYQSDKFRKFLKKVNFNDEKKLELILFEGFLKKKFDELLDNWHFDNKEILQRFRENFPKLHRWILITHVLSDDIVELKILNVTEYKCDFHIKTETFLYSFHAEKTSSENPKGQLDCSFNFINVDLDICHLEGGPYSKNVWIDLVNQLSFSEADFRQDY